MSGLGLCLYTLSNPSNRCGERFTFYGIDAKGEIYECGIITTQKQDASIMAASIRKDTYVIIGGKFSVSRYTDTPFVTIPAGKAMVFGTSDTFPVNQAKIDSFENPPSSSFQEVCASPKKKRITVTANINSVSRISSGPTWKRRDVMLAEDTEARRPKKLCLKLWGDTSDMIREDDIGTTVTIKNAVVAEFKKENGQREKQLTSTEIMEVKENIPEQTLEDGTYKMNIIGASQDESFIQIITNKFQTIPVPVDIYETGLKMNLDEFIRTTPCDLSIQVENNVVTKIQQATSVSAQEKTDKAETSTATEEKQKEKEATEQKGKKPKEARNKTK